MARTFKRSERLDALAEPNITPLIDLAFSLLIIFMITTPLLEQTIPLELPVEDPRDDAQRTTEVQFQAVGVEGGSYFWGDQRIDRSEMRERLVALRDREDGTVLNVRASGLASYQEVIDLLSLIQDVGLRRISLDTQVGLE
ncbi:MAG: biopolymer transporter ExbD [Opitutales bacterium]|nr:biopolymer transporter ExbD [Opitutales bacterium]